MTADTGIGQPKASFVVPTFNRCEELRDLLASLAEQTVSPDEFEIVVVNDGSTDGTAALFEELRHAPPYPRLVSQENAGPAAARNRGLREARGDVVVFVDDDLVASPDLLARHLELHTEYPGAEHACLGLVAWSDEAHASPLVKYLEEGDQYLAWNFVESQDRDDVGWRAFWSCNISLKRCFLLDNGTFDEEAFRKPLGEDLELGRRLESAGLRIHFREEAVAFIPLAFSFAEFAERQCRKGRAQHKLRKHGISDWNMNSAEERCLYSQRALTDIVAAVEEFSAIDETPREVLHAIYPAALHFAMLVGAAEQKGVLQEDANGIIALLFQQAVILEGVHRAWSEKDRQVADAKETWKKKDRQLVDAKKMWKEKDRQLVYAKEMWKKKDRQLADAKEMWQEKDRQLADAKEMWQDMNRQFYDATIMLETMESRLADAMAEERDRHNQIVELTQRLTETESELRYFRESLSWRCTKPLRKLLSQLKRST